MMNLDRLLLRINAVLDGDAEGFEARALASEYTSLNEGVRERLRQCVTLIKAGEDHAALQVAEAEPPVLDLASKLAFDRSAQWREYCKANRLPTPARIEDRLVDPVNALYSKEIGESHPLYRDYRSAVRERDDMRALGVLRSIARINTSDRNARDEYARLSAKLRREQLDRLARTLGTADESGIIAIMEGMESSGLGPCPDDATWKSAQLLREKSERKSALEEALRLIPLIEGFREKDNREGAIPLLGRARSLEKQFGFTWPEAAGTTLAEAERRMAALAAEAETQRLAAERREALTKGIDELEDSAADASRTKPRLLADARLLLADARAEEGLPEEEIGRAQAVIEKLEAEIGRANSRRFLTIGVLVAASLGIIAVGATRFSAFKEGHDFVASLERAEKSGDAGGVADFLREAKSDHARLSESKTYKPRVDALAVRYDQQMKSLGEAVAELESLSRDASDGTKPVSALRDRVASLATAVETLPKDFRSRLTPDVQKTALKIDERAITAPTDKIEAGLPKGDAAFTADAAFVGAAAELDAALKAPGSASPQTLARGKAALEAARKHVSEAEAAALTSAATKEAAGLIAGATTLDGYLAGVKALGAVPAGTKESADAAKISAAADTLKKLPEALMSPEAVAMRDAAKSGARDLFLATDATAAESANAGKFAALAKFRDVWRATLTSYAREGGSVGSSVWLSAKPQTERSELSGGSEVRITAKFLKADGSSEDRNLKLISFEGRTPNGETLEDVARAPEADILASAARLFDTGRGAFTEAPLAFLDRTLASDASPLLKAWIHRQVVEIVAERPGSWGAVFSPEFREDAEKLTALSPAPLPRDAWLTPERYPELKAKLAAFYEKKRGPYLPAATARAEFVGKFVTAGTAFAGHADASGSPVIAAGALSQGDRVFGLDESYRPAVLGDAGAQGEFTPAKKAAPFSPLLKQAVSPDKAGAGPEAVSILLPKP